MQLTGTFLDEITHDIPSSNWGPKEWEKDFKAMKSIGIDTVIVIRNGYKNKTTFDSKVVNNLCGSTIPVPFDLLEVFLDQAEANDMDLFFGTYDSGNYWMRGDYQKEVDINRAFVEEAVYKYGMRRAFKGWYISHEVDTYNPAVMKVYRQLGKHLKDLKDMPILISPYIHGKKQFAENPTTLADHEKQWDKVFSEIQDCVDIVAFQDGNVDFSELQSYLEVNSKLAGKYGITTWTNVETFDRDMPWKFPPISWPALLYKIQQASASGTDKLITFEFSHFMSPNSIYKSARNLFDRYVEFFENDSNGLDSVLSTEKKLADLVSI